MNASQILQRNSSALLNQSGFTFSLTARARYDCRVMLSSYISAVCCTSPEKGLVHIEVCFHPCDSKLGNNLLLWVQRGKYVGFWKTTVCCLMAGVLCCYTSCRQMCCCRFCDVGVYTSVWRRESERDHDNGTAVIWTQNESENPFFFFYPLPLQSKCWDSKPKCDGNADNKGELNWLI